MDLARLVANTHPNGIVQVPAGRYAVNLVLRQPVTLLALGEVVLDGGDAGPVVCVACEPGVVRLAGFTLVHGLGLDLGGAVFVAAGTVELKRCTLRFNHAPTFGGGALGVSSGHVTLKECLLEANTGRQGGGVLAEGDSVVELLDSTVVQNVAIQGGGLAVKEGATLRVTGCTVADNKVVSNPKDTRVAAEGGALFFAGTTTRKPSVTVEHSIISERARGPSCIFTPPSHPGVLMLRKNVLPPWCASLAGDNQFATPKFTYAAPTPYSLAVDSQARPAPRPLVTVG